MVRELKKMYYGEDDPHLFMRQTRNFIIIALTVFLGILGTANYEILKMVVADHYELKTLQSSFNNHCADQEKFSKEVNERIMNSSSRGGGNTTKFKASGK